MIKNSTYRKHRWLDTQPVIVCYWFIRLLFIFVLFSDVVTNIHLYNHYPLMWEVTLHKLQADDIWKRLAGDNEMHVYTFVIVYTCLFSDVVHFSIYIIVASWMIFEKGRRAIMRCTAPAFGPWPVCLSMLNKHCPTLSPNVLGNPFLSICKDINCCEPGNIRSYVLEKEKIWQHDSQPVLWVEATSPLIKKLKTREKEEGAVLVTACAGKVATASH